MPFCFSLFVVSLQCICFVSSCDYTCPDKPVFTPSSLVVKYGDSAFAMCVPCQSGCDESLANLEASGYKEKNGSTIKWKVSSLTEWKSDPICYYTDHNGTQCCSTLKVTLYQMPTNVSISVLNHSGPMLEKSQYNLVCEVRDVAPAENLTVTFYRGQTELGKAQYSRTTSRKPENGSFSLSLNATKEDDGAQFSCGAKLELGPEGPQRPLVVRSQSLTATVHYGPDLQATVNPDQITVKEKGTLRLNCSAVGNPNPSYIWTLPFRGPHFNDGVLTIETASSQHEGQYNCTVSNSVKTVSVLFNVKVQSLEATSSAAPQADSSFTTARSTVTTPSGPTSDVTPQFSLQYLDVEDLLTLFAESSFDETRDEKATKEEEKAHHAPQNKDTGGKKEQDSTAQTAVDRPAEEFAKRSVDLANAGNRLAASGQFELAVKCFTDAIRYNPMEFKLFGNRSLCFERLQQYGNALRDAELALSLEPNWIKGLFRKGKALCGLKRYYEASLVYKEVLKLDSTSADAVQELKKAQTLHLMEMGFSWVKSSEALRAHPSLEEAVEALFAAEGGPGHAVLSAGCEAQQEEDDDEGEWVVLQGRSPRSSQSQVSEASDQTRPKSKSPPPSSRSLTKESLFSVWVGTLAPSMTYVKLHELFSRAGTVYSIKMLLEQQCAIIYYTRREDCEQAIHCLHGMVVEGAPLTVRHPYNTNGGKPGSSLQKKECFFWRTTGCTRPDCTFKHVPEHKNIDKDKFTSRLGQGGHTGGHQ